MWFEVAVRPWSAVTRMSPSKSRELVGEQLVDLDQCSVGLVAFEALGMSELVDRGEDGEDDRAVLLQRTPELPGCPPVSDVPLVGEVRIDPQEIAALLASLGRVLVHRRRDGPRVAIVDRRCLGVGGELPGVRTDIAPQAAVWEPRASRPCAVEPADARDVRSPRCHSGKEREVGRPGRRGEAGDRRGAVRRPAGEKRKLRVRPIEQLAWEAVHDDHGQLHRRTGK